MQLQESDCISVIPLSLKTHTEQSNTGGSIMRKFLKWHKHLQRKKKIDPIISFAVNYRRKIILLHVPLIFPCWFSLPKLHCSGWSGLWYLAKAFLQIRKVPSILPLQRKLAGEDLRITHGALAKCFCTDSDCPVKHWRPVKHSHL